MNTKVAIAVFLAAGLATLTVAALAQPPANGRPSPSADQPSLVAPADVYDPIPIGANLRPSGQYSSWPANADPAARKLQADEFEFARQTGELVRQLAAAKGDSDQEKIKAADYVVDNSGSFDETRKQVVEIYSELKGLAEKSA